ncbi:hypothetical protein K491DRAFT_684038 [Lophiostoma macrostomum CBS 122681]|uniref:Uncharacterized protein n=1 Tax=Lophiostoma macrostomum CBS 122681 TaxID=1314788 RepID=A0A6A6SQD1_9PLEO|nr:hypothetical protein K491DRAFT_684038 [Lophiostoma macrostomum CBS 122681]
MTSGSRSLHPSLNEDRGGDAEEELADLERQIKQFPGNGTPVHTLQLEYLKKKQKQFLKKLNQASKIQQDLEHERDGMLRNVIRAERAHYRFLERIIDQSGVFDEDRSDTRNQRGSASKATKENNKGTQSEPTGLPPQARRAEEWPDMRNDLNQSQDEPRRPQCRVCSGLAGEKEPPAYLTPVSAIPNTEDSHLYRSPAEKTSCSKRSLPDSRDSENEEEVYSKVNPMTAKFPSQGSNDRASSVSGVLQQNEQSSTGDGTKEIVRVPKDDKEAQKHAIEKERALLQVKLSEAQDAERIFEAHFKTYEAQFSDYVIRRTGGKVHDRSNLEDQQPLSYEQRQQYEQEFGPIYLSLGQDVTKNLIEVEKAFHDAKVAAKNVKGFCYHMQTSDFGKMSGDNDDINTVFDRDFDKNGKRKRIHEWREDNERGYKRTKSEMHFALSGSPDDVMFDSSSVREDDAHHKQKISKQQEHLPETSKKESSESMGKRYFQKERRAQNVQAHRAMKQARRNEVSYKEMEQESRKTERVHEGTQAMHKEVSGQGMG